MIPAAETAHDALPRLRPQFGSDTPLLLARATTSYIQTFASMYVRYWNLTKLL